MLKQLLAAAALAGLAASSYAAEPGKVYAGVDVGATRIHGDNDHSHGAFAGYQINDRLAVEAGYRRLASENYGAIETRTDQASLSVLGGMRVSNAVSVYGRFGVARVSEESGSTDFSFKGHENKALAGVGVAYQFGNQLTARAELQKTVGAATNMSVGLGYSF